MTASDSKAKDFYFPLWQLTPSPHARGPGDSTASGWMAAVPREDLAQPCTRGMPSKQTQILALRKQGDCWVGSPGVESLFTTHMAGFKNQLQKAREAEARESGGQGLLGYIRPDGAYL